ncbi:hypothetical protein C4J85_0611 [Pseudomonas sp. R4-34-07]|nr:hypothetical protein C4J85_0611 [Pseudomonas sp. R4-34-07]
MAAITLTDRGVSGPESKPDATAIGDRNVGGGLLPIAVGQNWIQPLTHRHREQAPSHIGSAVWRVDGYNAPPSKEPS